MNLIFIILVFYINCNVICLFLEDEERKNFILSIKIYVLKNDLKYLD